MVGHIGMPRDLADYVQESGRAGRDRAPSESVVLLPSDVPGGEAGQKRRRVNRESTGLYPRAGDAGTYQHKQVTSDEREMAAEVDEFIGARCRRVVLDRVMDGRYDRAQCEEGEEVCDACQESQRQIQAQQSREAFLSALDQAEHAVPDKAIEFEQDIVQFEQQESQRSWIDFHAWEANQEEAYEVEELERQLQRFQGRCVWCFAQGRTGSSQHRLIGCSTYFADQIRVNCDEFIAVVQKGKTMEGYSCCMYCYVPQAICQHWKAKSQDGRWEQDPTKDCQFKGVIVEAFWSMVMKGRPGTMDWLREWGHRDGYDIDDDEGCLRWLGKKVEWGGIEANKLIQAFTYMAREVQEIEELQEAYPAEQEREERRKQDRILDSGIDMPSSAQAKDVASSPPPYPTIESSPGWVSEGPAGPRASAAHSRASAAHSRTSSVHPRPRPAPYSDELMPEAVIPLDSSPSQSSAASTVSFDRGFVTKVSVTDRFEDQSQQR